MTGVNQGHGAAGAVKEQVPLQVPIISPVASSPLALAHLWAPDGLPARQGGSCVHSCLSHVHVVDELIAHPWDGDLKWYQRPLVLEDLELTLPKKIKNRTPFHSS